MSSVFNQQILADKLSKLNNTQQCIETLSHWCIFHRKEAELVVETWSKQFHSSEQEQKVPFLYLANDILQNSKRKGTEYVTEFWKVLPGTLKDVVENGTEHGKNAVSRLVGIWEERRVFGSRKGGLKDLFLGKEPLPPLELNKNKKRSRSIRIVKRDSRYIKIKVAIGGTMEKIVSAFHSLLSDHFIEDSELNKCKAAIRRVEKMEEGVNAACSLEGDPRRNSLTNELKDEETLLKQSVEKLKSIEETRLALVSRLREAVKEQESELENVRTQLQLAEAQIEEAGNMRRRLNNEPVVVRSKVQGTDTTPPRNSLSGDIHKKTAAALADKLAASTSSLQMMTSVLSSFAAAEAKNAGLMTSTNQSNSFHSLENHKTASSATAAQPLTTQAITQQPQMVLMPQQPSHVSTPQTQYQIHPVTPNQQYVQPSVVGMPYVYGNLPPPPQFQSPPPPQFSIPGPALTPQQPMSLTQPPMLLTQHQPVAPSYRPLQPPSMQFFTYPNQPQ